MRAVVQRVKKSSVTVGDKITGKIGQGLMVLIGVEDGDSEKDADYIADKVCGLRIFEDEQGKMNLSVEDIREAVKLCKGKAETECSGNVTKENIAKLVDIGVDFISSGALTHSAPIMDLSLKNLHAIE